MHAWHRLSGQTLLERYGMTEAGMILSNSLSGPRLPGHVGFPLPFVNCRLVSEDNRIICVDSNSSLDKKIATVDNAHSDSESGELQISGPTIFSQYLNLHKATSEAFVDDVWFSTGDIAVRTAKGAYRILGRKSSDIIKSKGFKLSSLEIERALLSHPWIKEVAVVGVPDNVEGEVVTALIVLKSSSEISAEIKIHTSNISENKIYDWTDEELLRSLTSRGDLQAYFVEIIRTKFLSYHLASYKHPKIFHFVDFLPRNQLGKVNKKTVLKDCGVVLNSHGKI
jgi:malonyl-CoA/methylmalonyl-CoA synthetase